MRVRSPTFMTMPFPSNVLKPDSSALMLYVPFGRLGRTYCPDGLLVVLKFSPVETSVALMTTLGTTPPVESDTVPTIVACCAKAKNWKASSSKQQGNTEPSLNFTNLPLDVDYESFHRMTDSRGIVSLTTRGVR